ncbi:hypothetical protein ASG01_05450 [Chryseobacterium sp. Leaf180]|uniref:energy transducer TonB n=1 Tax=Chryseobacterium sp. Leaf180 TaxID=1736289 RepID=UPI0007017486|nr:energy transducer TonB [Chryseobacterium sp. Leaf180]KQR95291.1 hypothetical protein ASG01_05450 [Chryseobacterium sp. Leaf180]
MRKSVKTIAVFGILLLVQSFETQKKTTAVEITQQKTAAEFPGGMNAFYKELSAKTDRSKIDAKMKSAKGTMTFTITADGLMKNISVETSDARIRTLLENALKSIPQKWKPATENQVNVESQMTLPLVWAPE